MHAFIEYLIKELVSKPEQVVIDEVDEEGTTIYNIGVAQEDMGLVIGKEGNTINSLRNLVKAKAIKDNVRVRIQLNEMYDTN
ncbi:hypothetical protein A2415_01995 [candidate division WWE3 bacterium RIFOXYC1_FULL_39_7]|uniref:RNA-binding protein KhpA n=2 Tax=Katanobacteria TaxID=422282 RepID=A0A1F4X8X0_UNCKA|nr:MAG: hypothetical protein A2415_01995 [candidate division WWE3 bacterium RIFOXYC1_FULL_39_7]OGC78126.1 MAG: hypothetical protein A2619_05240 [candidate division WWE3 bacterium RIFOXYD1_FULL_39_9]